MTTPSGIVDDPDLLWKKRDQRRSDIQSQNKAADTVSAPADQLSTDPYYNRLNTIRDTSTSLTTASIATDNQQRQYQQQLAAQRLAAMQGDAYGAAQEGMGQFAGGGGSYGADGGWGSGGAQGVANVLRQAGFPESMVPTFMAIAKAESGWNPSAVNNSNRNGSIDRGLFQINSVHQGNSWYPANPLDPYQSAVAAYNIYKSQGLGAWSVYNSGAYKQFLGAAPPIQPYAANTGGNTGLRTAQVGTAMSFAGVPTSGARAQALALSRKVLSIPYVWGGNSLNSGVDCSGLVQQVYAAVGIQMPRQARAQATTGVRVSSYNQLTPGDLVAFKWAGGYAGPNTVSHISIYIGNGQIIEAAGGSRGDIRSLGNSQQDQGAIYIHTRFPGE